MRKKGQTLLIKRPKLYIQILFPKGGAIMENGNITMEKPSIYHYTYTYTSIHVHMCVYMHECIHKCVIPIHSTCYFNQVIKINITTHSKSCCYHCTMRKALHICGLPPQNLWLQSNHEKTLNKPQRETFYKIALSSCQAYKNQFNLLFLLLLFSMSNSFL